MKPLPRTPEMFRVAKRVVWFKDPDETIADPVHFLAHVMTYGMEEDLRVVLQVVGDEALCEALQHAGPGIFDQRSWAYWNLRCGIPPDTPLPVRRFE